MPTYNIDWTAPDQGAATDDCSRTIKDFVDLIGATKNAVLRLRHNSPSNTTTYTLTTSETIPSNIALQVENGAIIDGAGTLTISGPFEAVLSQCFGTSITILFGVNSTTEIHPEWWGEFPNGSNDTAVLNKAIAAADLVGTYDGSADASIVVRPGRYWVAHNSLSIIKTNFYAPHAVFVAVANTSLTGKLFQFDFTESGDKTVYIGEIFGDPSTTTTEGDHYNIGINILGGDSVWMRINTLASLYMGIASEGAVHEKHVGMWDIEVDTIMGCRYGIHANSGTQEHAAFEINRIDVKYVAYSWTQTLNLDSSAADSKVIYQNWFRFHCVELHHFANLGGFRLVGDDTFSNKIIVDGSLIPPSGTGKIVTVHTDAYDNLFELCYIDWTKVYSTPPSAGYNIFHQTFNQSCSYPGVITNDFGRSEVMLDAVPTVHPWRQGDKVWNSKPSAGSLGWICVASGTPGTWETAVSVESLISYEDGQVFYENEAIFY